MSPAAVLLVAFTVEDMTALMPGAEVLIQFNVLTENILWELDPGEIPDFSAFAARVQKNGVRVVISALRDSQLARALAAALLAPLIRVPVPKDRSPAAALHVLTEDAGPAGAEEPGGANACSFATVAVGEAGAKNAALLAVSILALSDPRLRDAWTAFREEQTQAVLAQPPPAG